MTTETPTNQPATPTTEPQEPAWVAGLQRLITRNGGSDRAAELLYQENYDHLARIRQLEQQVPPQGAVVLTGEDAARWEALKGYTPDDVQSAITERDTLKAQVEQTARTETHRKALKVAGLNPDAVDVLDMIPNLPAIDVADDHATVAVDGTSVPLAEYLQTRHALLMPALQVQSAPAQPSYGVAFPRQEGRPGAKVSAVNSYIQQTYKPRQS